jgi:HEPN domain-containing protein
LTDLVREWIAKAEGDYRIAILGMGANDASIYDGVCFHCQQCIEKYLKALCVQGNIHFEKKHDLIYLLNLLVVKEPFLEFIRSLLMKLNDYAIDIRYPGTHTDKVEMLDAIQLMKTVRTVLREKLGLTKQRAKKRR